MGTGTGKHYIPYIMTSEFNSRGTTAVILDWKTDRGVHCLSQAEMCWYYLLRWDDSNVDIREQFPLERDITEDIASDYGIKHPGKDKDYIMTTDFLVTKDNGKEIAYSVKVSRDLSERELQILCIEKLYWANKGIGFKMLFKTDVNLMMVRNIRIVVPFYNVSNVFDDISEIKHKIAVKDIPWDMENEEISNISIRRLIYGQ